MGFSEMIFSEFSIWDFEVISCKFPFPFIVLSLHFISFFYHFSIFLLFHFLFFSCDPWRGVGIIPFSFPMRRPMVGFKYIKINKRKWEETSKANTMASASADLFCSASICSSSASSTPDTMHTPPQGALAGPCALRRPLAAGTALSLPCAYGFS